MVKRVLLFLLSAAAVLTTTGCGPKIFLGPELQKEAKIMDASGRPVSSFSRWIKEISDADVVFIGEFHDDSLTHAFESAVLEGLWSKKKTVALALEMFERDVQAALDAYRTGKIDEETFLKTSRPWPNYLTDYRPLVEFAREKGLPVLAMNVPRSIANRVAVRGDSILSALPDSQKVFTARELKVLDDDYRKRFFDQMKSSPPGPMGRFNPEYLYKAQCLKDDTMAEYLCDFLSSHQGTSVVSYQGNFHSDHGLGIVKKLKLLDSSLKIVVVSVIPLEAGQTPDVEKEQGRGDWMVFVPRIVSRTGGGK